MYKPMTRSEWFKYGDKRINALIDAINSNDPILDVSGKEINVLKNKANIESIKAFSKAKDSVFFLTLKGNKTIQSNQIGKSHLFGGKGAGQGATGTTANGEALQCLYLAAMLKEGRQKPFNHYSALVLKKHFSDIDTDRKFEEMMGADISWHYSAYVSAEALIARGYVQRDHVLHRGSNVMKDIYNMKKKAFKEDGKPVLNDDKWNPGDIWAVRKGIDVKKVLDASSVSMLNATLKKAYDNRDIVGISLKQINSLKKKAKFTEYNLDGAELGEHTYSHSLLKSDRKGSNFWSFKGGYIFFDGSRKMDVRAPTALGALNVEIQGKGARGGRSGYASIVYAAKKYLDVTLKSNNEFKSEAESMQNGSNETKAKELWKKVNYIHKDVEWPEFWEQMQAADKDRIHANLVATEIIYTLDKASAKNANSFVSYLVNMAGSKTSDSSVYVKVEAS